MAEWFESGRILLAIVGSVFVEAIALVVIARRIGAGLSVGDVAFQLGAGACLMMATRSALLDEPWTITATWVTAALPIHLVDVYRRFR